MADGFEELYGQPPSVAADAPGRVNLIGEHTDYNGGYVMPLALPQRTRGELRPRRDLKVRAWSANTVAAGEGAGGGKNHPGGPGIAEYTLGEETAGRGWLDYVQGVTATLGLDGHALSGFEARIESAVPPGAGLSSSAALAVARCALCAPPSASGWTTWKSPGSSSARRISSSGRRSGSWTRWPPAWRTSIACSSSTPAAWPSSGSPCPRPRGLRGSDS